MSGDRVSESVANRSSRKSTFALCVTADKPSRDQKRERRFGPYESKVIRNGLHLDPILDPQAEPRPLPPQRERKQRVAGGDRDVLTSIDGEAHRGSLNRRAERDVPQRLARLRVQRDEIALPVP
jgi:hypothetical protein